MQQTFARKRSLSKKKGDKGNLKITFNDIYDISCTDVFSNKNFRIAHDQKSASIGETLENDVYNETQFIKLKFRVISEEEMSSQHPAQRQQTMQPSDGNNSFVEGNIKTKRYEFEINLKQMFEQCKDNLKERNSPIYTKTEQVPYYEQLQQQSQQQSKKDPQGFAFLTFTLILKVKKEQPLY